MLRLVDLPWQMVGNLRHYVVSVVRTACTAYAILALTSPSMLSMRQEMDVQYSVHNNISNMP